MRSSSQILQMAHFEMCIHLFVSLQDCFDKPTSRVYAVKHVRQPIFIMHTVLCLEKTTVEFTNDLWNMMPWFKKGLILCSSQET